MPDALDDPRLRSLLDEADRTLAILRDPTPHGRSADEVMESLDILHRDLGRRLHDLWQMELRDQVADPVPSDAIEELESLEEWEDDPGIATLEPDGPVVGPAEQGAWVDDLQDLLALLEVPDEDSDAVALAIESSRVQWATVGLSQLWPRFPEPIQVALLGMLAARVRFLTEHMAVDLGPQRALERLADYRRRTGLALVVGLVADREPESGTWTGDALHWWDMLTAGIEA